MNHRELVVAASLALAALLAGTTARAELEEVIVTAQKKEQSAQSLGISVSVFDEEALRELGTSTMTQIASQISSVEAYAPGSSLQSLHVRGVGLNESQGNFDTPVAVHSDEVYMSKPWMVGQPMFDIARLEVLKGPQGTLLGRNVTGGAANRYTRMPTRTFEAEVQGEADQHARYNLQGHVSGPLAKTLSGRLSAYFGFGDGGPWKNLYTGDDHGEQNIQLYRGQLLWDSGDTSVRLLLHGGRDRSQPAPSKSPGIFNPGLAGICPEVLDGSVSDRPSACLKFGGFAPNPDDEREPDDPYTINQDYALLHNNTFLGGYVRVEHTLARQTLTSITAYEAFERDERDDALGSPLVDANLDNYDDIGQFSQELRLSSEPGGRWRYVAGLAWEEDHLTEFFSAASEEYPASVLPPGLTRLAAEFDQDVTTKAAFWHNEIVLHERLTAIAAARWTREQVELDAVTFLGPETPMGIEDRIPQVFVIDALKDKRRDDNLSYKFGLDWAVNPRTLLYASASTGFRGGGYSVPLAGEISMFDAEEILALETGLKTRLFQETLQVNLAAYRYEYDDLQISVDDEFAVLQVPVTRNIGRSQAHGLEADLWWSPSDRWDIKAGAGYMDAEFKRSDRTVTTYVGVIPLQGKRPINTPEWTVNALARYQRRITPGLDLILMGDARYTGERYLEVTNQPFDRAPSYWLANAYLALRDAGQRWEIALRGENIFDEKYLTFINNVPVLRTEFYGMPASWSAIFRYRFH